MSDIAELGIKVDSVSLEKLTKDLNSLQSAAKGLTTTNSKLSREVTGAALSVARAKSTEASSYLKSLQASKSATKADLEKARSALKVAQAEQEKVNELNKAAIANDKLARATLGVVAAEKRRGATRSQTQLAAGGIANDNIPNRFNTANVAAQFQDIGVTAAMGMSPLTIAIQQGTQLSAILNSMKNPLQGLKAAFLSVINPVSLLSIGLVAVVASLIQFVDWSKFAKNALNNIASGIEVIGPYAVAAAASLALFYSPAIIGGLVSATKAIVVMGNATLVAGTKMATAWVIANPMTFIALLVAAGAAIVAWAAATVEPFRRFANIVIGIFKGLSLSVIGAITGMLETINNILKDAFGLVVKFYNGVVSILPDKVSKKISWDIELQNTNEGAKMLTEGGKILADSLKAGFDSSIQPEDYVGKIGDAVGGGLQSVADKFREWASGIGSTSEETANKVKDAWKDIVSGAERTIASLKAEGQALRLNSFEAAKLRTETKLLNEAKQKNINLSESQRNKISQLATEMSKLELANKKFSESIEFTRGTFKNFIIDFDKGVRSGQSAWESFGNTVLNVLNRIQDRLLESSLNTILDSFTMGGSDFIGPRAQTGFLSSLGSSLMSGFTGAFGGFFAKGGIANKPSIFGEAGPEAAVPLPDGRSIPVSFTGDRGSSSPSITINNNNAQNNTVSASVSPNGKDITVMIDEAVAKNVRTPGTKTYNSIRSFGNAGLNRG